jgi:proteic killer suppression protein
VDVEFRTKHLEECFRREAAARQAWGATIARRYIERILIIQSAKDIGDLFRVPPLRFHALKGGRQGQYAMTLVDRWRLIVTLGGEEVTVVRVEEVSKHYGD